MQNIADIRKDYKLQSLNENEVAINPFLQFDKWWADATKSDIVEVNAMTLSTADKNAMPDARIVLLKGYDKNGFVFFTNYNSKKGIELTQNPKACLVFFWKELERQVRIWGNVEKIKDIESINYFNSRPIGSKIGAWASPQSKSIKDKTWLTKNFELYTAQFKDTEIPKPPHWGGYCVKPFKIEFWQGRPNRMHDRIQYLLQNDINWNIERLAP